MKILSIDSSSVTASVAITENGKILSEKFINNGLDVKIWMFDHNFNDMERVLWSLENCNGLKKACNGVAFHYYSGAMEAVNLLSKRYPELPFHFTEGGPRLGDNYATDWCKWGMIALKALHLGFSSLTGWNLMLDELGGPNVGPFIGICGGLVTRDSRDGALRYSGQYRAFEHISPYVTPDSEIYPLGQGDDFGSCMGKYPKLEQAVEGVLIDNHDGKKIAILANPNQEGLQIQLELDGTFWYVELPPDSLSTVIFE